MSKQKLFTTRGHLLTNTSLLRTGTPRAKRPFAPEDQPHVSNCGCLSCRVTHRADEAIDKQLGKLSTSARARNALAPTPGVLGNSRPKGAGPLMPTRGVLAGDAS